ncbi:MAG: DNA alkylation repair protein [Flavitalea sp.]
MNTKEILEQLKELGSETIKNTLKKHGAKEPFYGVKVEDLKKIQKKIKTDSALALELYATGNSDAMYLAGLIGDGKDMTEKQLNEWAEKAPWQMISEYTVPWVTSEHPDAWKIGLNWIEDKKEHIASSGWSTLAAVVSMSTTPDIKTIKSLLDRIEKTIHKSPNRVRYTMNGFLINVGAYVPELSEHAKKTGESIGKVFVDMGGTSCKVPYAPEYIEKSIARGSLQKKKKTVKC